MPRLCEFNPGICLTTEEKHGKTSVRVEPQSGYRESVRATDNRPRDDTGRGVGMGVEVSGALMGLLYIGGIIGLLLMGKKGKVYFRTRLEGPERSRGMALRFL